MFSGTERFFRPGYRAQLVAEWLPALEGVVPKLEAGATVADVAATFRIDDFTHTVIVRGHGRIPVNVALACKWTWFCSTRFTTDVHPNRQGYGRIARTFNRKLESLLP